MCIHVYTLEAELAREMLKAISGDARYTASIFFNHDLTSDFDSIRTDLDLLRDSLLPLIMNAVQNTSERHGHDYHLDTAGS